ncbi:MAG: hypothetical protein FJ279_22110 [Planctomycetes bacterium]|nr:hypothetical protein [Planctomycetota bacterium]
MPTGKERFRQEMALQGEPVVRSHISITYPVWKQYGEKLAWLEKFSPYVGVSIARTPSRAANTSAKDVWGCDWRYPLEALDGICVGHPLASWSALGTYQPPDPAKYTDWEQSRKAADQAKAKGSVYSGGTDHGFIFLRMTYLRGFDNFMMDVADQPPEMERLIGIVEGYWRGVLERWVALGADQISFGDDLGLQHALPMKPETWRRVIKPSYKRLFGYCRAHGVHVAHHSDGYVVDVIPDLIECGVSALNPQDLVNGLENIRRLAKGKVFIRLDIDRQNVTVFGTPDECDAHVRNCIQTLGSPTGGLSTIWGVYPGTPLANIEAVARALDKYATHWGRG